MHSEEIQELVDSIELRFGKVEYYGSNKSEEHGVSFRLEGIEATFSVSTLDGTLKSTIDIQVEGIPAGDYLYTDEVSASDFIELLSRYRKSENHWP